MNDGDGNDGVRLVLTAFLTHLHSTGALSAPPSGTWVEAFLEKHPRAAQLLLSGKLG